MKQAFSANMRDGPQLFSFRDNTFYYGAYYVLTFSENDQGKTLTVTVNSATPVCWIELWPAVYDGHDWIRWTTERGQTALERTGNRAQINPRLTWTILPGSYTLYFVKSSLTREAKDEVIQISVEISE